MSTATNTTLSQSESLPPVSVHLDAEILARHPGLDTFARELGRTPLIEVPHPSGGARIFAKCEWLNPTGSIKDRTAFALIYDLLRQRPKADPRELHILEYSGGNLAISLSRLCKDLGMQRTLVMASFMAPEVVQAMRDEGSDIVLVDKQKGFWAVMEQAFVLAKDHPEWCFLYQHQNQANLWMHRVTTGGELLIQLETADHGRPLTPHTWIASIGTGGTLIGVHEALRAHFPALELVATTPAELPYGSPQPPNGLPKYAGSGGLGCGRKQAFVEACEDRVTRWATVSYPDSVAGIAAFAARTGLRIGSSAAANWLVALNVARELGPDRTVLTVFPSYATPGEWDQAQSVSPDHLHMVSQGVP